MMAYADYTHCDICDCKAFYDANCNWHEVDHVWKLENVGDMKVLCDNCAKTHEVVIIEKTVDPMPQIRGLNDG